MVIVTYLLISLYAVLTVIAGIAQWKEKGFSIRTFLLIMVAITLLLSLWTPNKSMMIIIVSFILMHVLAIAEGLSVNGKLRLSHHIVRLGLHIFLLLLVYQFVM